MARLVFLVEEKSMKVLLDGLIPRAFPSTEFICVPHEGKQDLEKSIPRKLKAWREPGARFVVVRDNDNGDCRALKARLVGLCADTGRTDVLVRIACQELEAWYLGDPDALAVAFEDESLRALGRRERFRDPDAVVGASEALAQAVPAFHKVSGARVMARHLNLTENRSGSFRAFMAGLRRLVDSLHDGPSGPQE